LNEDPAPAGSYDRHFRLAEVFGQRGNEFLRAVQHLLGAGREEQALDTFLVENKRAREWMTQDALRFSEYIQSLPREWIDILEKLISVCRRLGRPQRQIFVLRTALVGSDSTNISDRTHLIELISRLYRDSGLADYHELGESGDDSKRLWQALEIAQKRYDATTDSERVFGHRKRFRS